MLWTLSGLQIAVPPAELLRRAFAEQLQADDAACGRALERCNANLRATRDLLLPRLISGEIDVTDLDIAMPEAAA